MEKTQAAPVRSLAANLALYLVPPLLLNGIIFGLGWDRDSTPNPYLPPGWAVGSIWMLLFAAMGTASWLLLKSEHGEVRALVGPSPRGRSAWPSCCWRSCAWSTRSTPRGLAMM
jgi:hypothetical protein